MTDEIKAFCYELRIASKKSKLYPDWFLYDGNLDHPDKLSLIRARAKEDSSAHQCPICWLASYKGHNKYDRYIDWQGVCQDMGMDRWNAQVIAKASDLSPGYDPEVRTALLSACGL